MTDIVTNIILWLYFSHIMDRITIPKREWDERLTQLLSSFDVFAPVENEFSCDYAQMDADTIIHIAYDKQIRIVRGTSGDPKQI